MVRDCSELPAIPTFLEGQDLSLGDLLWSNQLETAWQTKLEIDHFNALLQSLVVHWILLNMDYQPVFTLNASDCSSVPLL
jgi:hypothetical protein